MSERQENSDRRHRQVESDQRTVTNSESTESPEDDHQDPEGQDAAELFTIQVDGEEAVIPSGLTVEELKDARELSDESVLTFRDDDGFVALDSDAILSEEVDPGTEIAIQPLASTEVFGVR